MRLPGGSSFISLPWKIVVIFFLLGLCLRSVVFIEPHREGDELIYTALVEQLESGGGYSLQGSPLLAYSGIDRAQYDHKLFFHPPGGIGLFWSFHQLFGPKGFPLVQVFSYILFFWSMMLLAHLFGISSSSTGLVIAGGLSAFNPIMAHVTTHYWLDGPLLAFCTLATAVFVWAVVRKSYSWACVAGVLLGYASLIKITAFLVIPGVAVLAWLLVNEPRREKFLRFAACLIIPAIIVQLPWEIWQWIEVGTPFPAWAGKPSESLVASNRYVYNLTVVRTPWIYLTLLPRILWTIVPGILLYVFMWDNKAVRWRGVSLLTWIFVVLFFHIAVGFFGYSKVIRYVILVAPASVILFSMVMPEAIRRLRLDKPFSLWKGLYGILVIISALAFAMEIFAGIRSSYLYNHDLISTVFGL